ncbi:MAG: response regulator [Methanomicrobiales archaeon]|nr:response regulator [Methanomicrobiales archaeon]
MTRILYIDDETSLLTLTQIYLKEAADLDIEVADSAEEGLEKLRTGSFDAIISDYDMPDIDGIELLKLVRTENSSIPFIIFTGKGREEVVIEALNNGADFYLQKGGDPKPLFTELAHAVHHLVRRYRAENEAIRNENYMVSARRVISENIISIEQSALSLKDVGEKIPAAREMILKILKSAENIRNELENSPINKENKET